MKVMKTELAAIEKVSNYLLVHEVGTLANRMCALLRVGPIKVLHNKYYIIRALFI